MVTDINPTGLRKTYLSLFPDRDLHHLVPKSRGGAFSQFNLYPYDKKISHPAYHELLWNMRIDEVWGELSSIHRVIFDSSREYIYTPWIDVCVLDVGSEKERRDFEQRKRQRLEKTISAEWLASKWVKAFGGESLGTARKKMKEMMLYMVFGVNMLDDDVLFDNGNLTKFIEVSPCSDERLWAFQTCFGRNGSSVRAIKSKIAKTLR